MRCLDYNGTWAQCTPFDCKISVSYIESTYQTYFSKVNKKITTVYHCTFLLCLDVGYANNGERCRNKCQFHGPWSKEKSMCRTVAGQNQSCTPAGEFFEQCFKLETKYSIHNAALECISILTDPCANWPDN